MEFLLSKELYTMDPFQEQQVMVVIMVETEVLVLDGIAMEMVTMPIDSEVSLSVYNLQGREVSTLIDANIEAGYHSVQWNADNYSSGMYFVKMVAGEYISTQKLMLVK